MTYAKIIKELAPPGHDSRHIEAIIRLRNANLEGLSRSEFRKEVLVAVACIAANDCLPGPNNYWCGKGPAWGSIS